MLQTGSCNRIWLGEAFCLACCLLDGVYGLRVVPVPAAPSNFTWPGLRGFWIRSSEFSGTFCFVWGLEEGTPEMPTLFSTPLRRGLHLRDGLVADNVVYILGWIPPLKLPLALSNHLKQACATINISSNLSQLATFSICMKRWLKSLCIGTDARHKQIKLVCLCR